MYTAIRRIAKPIVLLAFTVVFLATVVTAAYAQAPNAATNDAQASAENAALQSLLDVLRDDAARSQLIAELEATVAQSSQPEVVVETPIPEAISLPRRIALITQNIAEDAMATISQTWANLTSGRSVFSGLRGDEASILIAALPGLFLVIGITFSVFLVLRTLAKRLYVGLGRRADRSGFFGTLTLFLVSNIVDLFIVLLAWGLGYFVTILAVGEFGSIGIRQSMYLNAFLLVEIGKVAIRGVISPAASGLRLVPISDEAAKSINRSLGIVVSVLGYGQLLVVPIVNRSASFAAGNGVSALLSLLVLLYLVSLVILRRREVATWISTPPTGLPDAEAYPDLIAPTAKRGWATSLTIGISRVWHWIALAYLGVMFVVVMTQSANVTFGALVGSGKVLAALIVASLVSGWLSAVTVGGVTLPQDINQKLPLLQPRLNRFVTPAFGIIRLVILLVVLFFTLDVIGMIDVRGWLESQVGLQVTTSIISVALILLVAFALWLSMTSFVDFRLNPEYGKVATSREVTLLSLLRNAATIALIVLTLMFSLSEIGLNIGPLLASAGVLGLAIGFGAQKFVQDIITGIFIQFENAINVGDVITVGGTTGTVEKLSVRSVSLRDAQGTFHIIPFSSVNMVSNFTREFSYSVCDMGVGYKENVEHVKKAMHDAFDLLMEDPETAISILGPLEWFGINSFGDNAVVLRTRIKTIPGKQWSIGRAYNGYLKTVFDERNIEIPFPQRVVHMVSSGDDKDA